MAGMVTGVKAYAVKKALGYLNDNPEKGFDKIMKLVGVLDDTDFFKGQRDIIQNVLNNPDSNWYKLIMSLWDDGDANIRRCLFENLIVNATIFGSQKQEETKAKYDINVPWAILMDPTTACNLHCTGCWAAEYGNKQNLSFDDLDSIITQAKEMGTHFFIYTGGEPLVRKKDIIALCEKHNDCEFLAFTNATLIDDAFAEEMVRVGNFIPAISIEGYKETTDARRGEGTYDKIMNAMRILREHKCLFGASCTYTSQNTEIIGSEEYFDFLVDQKCKFAWFFTYMPVGVGAPTDLMATADQRKYMYDQIRTFRQSKPIFTMDFWNDGEYVDGCIAGGRYYLHINAHGDVEPCAFIHYADSNIHENTLLEAYQGKLFQEYRKNQPFNDNMLRPCPLLDNKDRLADMVHASGAHSTDLAESEDVDDLCAKCHNAADNWAPVADDLWANGHWITSKRRKANARKVYNDPNSTEEEKAKAAEELKD